VLPFQNDLLFTRPEILLHHIPGIGPWIRLDQEHQLIVVQPRARAEGLAGKFAIEVNILESERSGPDAFLSGGIG